MSKEEIILNGAADADNYYQVNMRCTNCSTQTRKSIPYTVTISEYEPVCPHCLCRTLVEGPKL